MAVLNSGTIIAVAEETVLGGGKATAWADIDVISCWVIMLDPRVEYTLGVIWLFYYIYIQRDPFKQFPRSF